VKPPQLETSSPSRKEPSQEPPSALLPKSKISDFELKEVVGIGNFGKVHKAFNLKKNRTCALKVLIKESVAKMKQVEHIISEKEVLEYLSSKHNECPFIMGIFSSF
jgi:serine/threonine protein kinase